MASKTFITTSWDDGHPLDLRVAELLAKFEVSGTFYIPRANEKPTLTECEIRALSAAFEIGAHTLGHQVLTDVSLPRAQAEISGSKSWVENITGVPCRMFCPPQGKYSRQHVLMAEKAGYVGFRSVALLSLDLPQRVGGIVLMPTTIQAHPHDTMVYARNTLKRAALRSIWRFVTHGRSCDWPVLARSLAREATTRGGVFHLWGHSWELQDNNQWERLECILAYLGDLAKSSRTLSNGQLCAEEAP